MIELIWDNKKEMLEEVNSEGFLKTNKHFEYNKDKSRNFNTTENIYIEGDNLEALKLLQKNYQGKIKMIYIDPPYNTEKKFIYNDTFRNKRKKECRHSGWINMMYPRLRLAKNLLSDDGVVFISIDDIEVSNLRKVCDEIIGENNFVANIIWERAYSPVNLKKHFSENHDFVICYAKNLDKLVSNGLKRSDDANNRYSNPDNDPRGVWKPTDCSVGPAVADKIYEITTPSGRKVLPPKGRCWLYTKERFEEMLLDNRISFGDAGDGVPRVKKFLTEVKDSITPMTIWKYTEVGHSQDAKQKLKKLFDDNSYFDYPKSVELIKRMVELYTYDDSIILDFFSGSATTAHAVMQLNAEDGGNRKFIMVQLPEECPEKSEARNAGYDNICEIGKERIRRAGDKILKDNKDKEGIENLDIGFKVIKIK